MTNSSQPKTWRDVLPIHPAAELFPRISEAELDALAKDIKQNGLRQRVALWSPGKPGDGEKMFVLDGINRLDALERADIKFMTDGGRPDLNGRYFTPLFERRIKVLKGVPKGDEPDVDPWDYVISVNIQRRHLSAEDKRNLIDTVLKAKPEQSDAAIAKQTKTSDKTVAKRRRKLTARSEIPNVETRTDTRGRKQPSAKPKKPPKATSPVKPDPIGSSPVRYSEAPATSVPPEVENFIILENFTSLAMKLIKLIMKNGRVRFANAVLSDDDIRYLAKFFADLSKARQDSGITQQSAEVSTEQRADHAVLGFRTAS